MKLADQLSGLWGSVTLGLIAFSIVFLVLVALSLMIMANRQFAEFIEGKKKPAAPATPKSSAPVQHAVATSAATGEDEDLVAVLAAAVAAVGCAGVVTGVRRATHHAAMRGAGASWRNFARTNNLEGLDG